MNDDEDLLENEEDEENDEEDDDEDNDSDVQDITPKETHSKKRKVAAISNRENAKSNSNKGSMTKTTNKRKHPSLFNLIHSKAKNNPHYIFQFDENMFLIAIHNFPNLIK
jgi:hypothetical protein